MMANTLAALGIIWAAAANHVWQSTVFAAAAGLLTLTLRNQQARVRYWMWLAASLKFLIPFSLLSWAGSHLAKPAAAAGAHTSFYIAVAEARQPLAHAAIRAVLPAAAAPARASLVLLALATVWLAGAVAVLAMFWMRWWRLCAVMREAAPLEDGREVDTLRRMEQRGGIRKRIGVRVSEADLEPGILGVRRPILLWPQAISQRLSERHMEAILAHEVTHVRRHDNLAALLHMAVEAAFWFNPLVWWVGARLVEEREHACDEEALRMGNDPGVYAESILKACEFCVDSRLACVSGVTGADLKTRIVRIMTHRVANRLDGPRRVLLGAVGAAAVAVPLAFGFMHPALSQAEPDVLPDAKFEVASIRPARAGDGRTMMMRLMSRPDDGRLYADNVTLKMLIHMAYQVQDSQITGGPSWMDTDRFDIQATADSALDAELRRLTPDQGRAVKERMLQRLLADRFQLTLRHETKELPIYSLVVAKGGPKLPPTKVADDAPGPDGVKAPGGMGGMFRSTGPGQITVECAPVSMFAQFLARELNRTVLDKTGLTGRYDFSLQWTPDENEQPMGPPGGGPRPEGAPAPQASGPSLFTALEDQLGLKLESQKGPVDVLGIDHVEKPSEN